MNDSVSRRTFLKLAGLTGAGTAAAATLTTTAYADDETTESTDTTTSSDNIYYPTGLSTDDITDLDTLNELMAASMDEQIATAEESLVLLMNDNDALPLAEGSNVTLLGCSTMNPYMHRTSNGSGTTYTEWADGTDYHPDMSYSEGMQLVYNVNTTMLDAYSDVTGTGTSARTGTTSSDATYPGNGVQEGAESTGESTGAAMGGTPEDFYTTPIDAEAPRSWYEENDLISSFADYGDAAIIMFTRYGNEDNDLGQTNGVDGISELALQPNERELLALAKEEKDAGVFERIIVILNTAHAMEVGDLSSEYGVDALVWMGAPGDGGMVGVTNVLTGNVSPSGHLGDCYPTDSTSAPANQNAAENVGIWANADEVLEAVGYTGNESSYSGSRNYDTYIVEAEGIYIGYKYYETRYEDCILGQGNASSTAGTFASDGAWDYNAEVTYPFGYGLSYTTFDQTLDSVDYDSDSETYTVTVTVTNTGSVAGRSVVQVYAQTPYGDYEKENEVEKSAIQLVAFGKTDTLEPGASETLEIEVDVYLLASYDTLGAKGYILSEGDYYLAIGDDAHDALNNVLAAKGATGMTDVLGNAADGDADKTYTWNQGSLDTETCKMSRVNDDVVVTNEFDDCDLDYWLGDGTVTYLSRSDWEATWPIKYGDVELTASDEMIAQLLCEYNEPDDAPAVSDFTTGADNGISLIMMRDYDDLDDPAWDEFVDQFTVDELTYLLNGGTEAVDTMGIPAETQIDDNTTIGSVFAAYDGGQPLSWPHEMNTAATFNHERFEARGRIMGLEAEFCNCSEVWYGGGNIHRTQFGGRNQQYYSEDPVLGYYVGAGEATGMQGVGVIYCQKHFAFNNQENARESAATFFREQGGRETELRHFEGAIAKGGAMGEMGGFNRIGLTYCNYSYALNTTLLREEWGFKGHVTTDAVVGSLFKQNFGSSLIAGTDYYCFNAMMSAMGATDAVESVTTLIDGGDGYILECLRQAVKRTCYSWTQTWTMNGLSSNTTIEKITPWWEYALDGALAVTGIGAVAALVGYVVPQVTGGKKEKEEEGDAADE